MQVSAGTAFLSLTDKQAKIEKAKQKPRAATLRDCSTGAASK